MLANKKLSGDIRRVGGGLACADWFSGKCEGDPLEVRLPSVGDVRPLKLEIEEDKCYAHWVRTRLRELWPPDPSV